jgi:hypothetical protein
MDVADARRLRELEKENAGLKRLLAEHCIEMDAMKEVIAKKWLARRSVRKPWRYYARTTFQRDAVVNSCRHALKRGLHFSPARRRRTHQSTARHCTTTSALRLSSRARIVRGGQVVNHKRVARVRLMDTQMMPDVMLTHHQ